MDELDLINEIDQMLATGVSASRAAHAEIQQYMNHFRQQARMRQAKEAKTGKQTPNINSKHAKNKKGE